MLCRNETVLEEHRSICLFVRQGEKAIQTSHSHEATTPAASPESSDWVSLIATLLSHAYTVSSGVIPLLVGVDGTYICWACGHTPHLHVVRDACFLEDFRSPAHEDFLFHVLPMRANETYTSRTV